MDKNNDKNKKDLKFVKSFFRFSISPQKHFNNLMLVFVLVFVCIAIFHSYLFYQVKFFDIQESDKGQVVPIPSINENKLEAILNKYNQKAKTQSSIQSIVPGIVDPSR